MRLYFRRSALLPSGFGGGGGVARAHIPQRVLVNEPSLKLVMNRSMRLKNQSLDKTVNIDISTKAGELGVPKEDYNEKETFEV